MNGINMPIKILQLSKQILTKTRIQLYDVTQNPIQRLRQVKSKGMKKDISYNTNTNQSKLEEPYWLQTKLISKQGKLSGVKMDIT